MKDSYRHKGLRRKLIETIREKGIKDERVLEAMENIPRHLFLESSFLEYAYEDKAFPIGSGQTISHPFTVAFQTEKLEVGKGDKILEVGTGSGYQASVLVEMGAKVYTIERQRALFLKTKKLLPELGYNPKMYYGDGYKGLPAFAPFDKIIVTAGAPFIPKDLVKQLKLNGLMIIPVGDGNSQQMILITKISEKEFEVEEFGDFKFVPLLEDKAND